MNLCVLSVHSLGRSEEWVYRCEGGPFKRFVRLLWVALDSYSDLERILSLPCSLPCSGQQVLFTPARRIRPQDPSLHHIAMKYANLVAKAQAPCPDT